MNSPTIKEMALAYHLIYHTILMHSSILLINVFSVRCTDYDVSTQNEDRMYNQATQNNELWKINHLAQNER